MIIFKDDVPEAGHTITVAFSLKISTLVSSEDHKLLAWNTVREVVKCPKYLVWP